MAGKNKTLGPDGLIVLGGSFNPPTLAHEALLRHAVAQSGASGGILVPSSDAYVRRKCAKARETLVFDEKVRYLMLQAMAARNPDFSVETGEYGDDGRGHSYDTMCRVQGKYPGKKLAFLVGSDKLRIIPRWHSIDWFLDEFWFVVTSRPGDDAEALIARNPTLSRYADKLILIPDLDGGLSGISSTQARALLRSKDPADEEKLAGTMQGEAIRIARAAMLRKA